MSTQTVRVNYLLGLEGPPPEDFATYFDFRHMNNLRRVQSFSLITVLLFSLITAFNLFYLTADGQPETDLTQSYIQAFVSILGINALFYGLALWLRGSSVSAQYARAVTAVYMPLILCLAGYLSYLDVFTSKTIIVYAVSTLIVSLIWSARYRSYFLLFSVASVGAYYLYQHDISNLDKTLMGELTAIFILAVLLGVTSERKRYYQFRQSRVLKNYINMLKENRSKLIYTNKKLEEANKAKSQFMTHMSHELRTPINAIIGFGDFLKMSEQNPDGSQISSRKRKEYLDAISSSGNHLLDMVNNVLDISRIEGNVVNPTKETFSIRAELHLVEQALTPDAHKKNINLFFNCETGLPKIHMEIKHFHQILENIIDNAVKFSPENSVIKVKAGRIDKEFIQLTVRDEGIGFKENQIERALQPFTQLSNVYSRQTEGAGLGLAIVHTICAAYGITLDIDSTEGKGTTIRLIFPPLLSEINE